MWLTVGRSLVVHQHGSKRPDRRPVVAANALQASWTADAAINHSAAAADIATLQARRKGRELWPLYAHGLGFDTVQNVAAADTPPLYLSEIVEVRPQCMHGRAVRACSPMSPLSVGPPHAPLARPCECADTEPVLNCRGVATPSARIGDAAAAEWPYWQHDGLGFFNRYERFPWSNAVEGRPRSSRSSAAAKSRQG